ncbi:MAG: hypothetical protein E4G96_08305 [Chrysiogenales bacterium]|nr:MAG: hypothetical protein E4G96_08305 [Chrysiogenales bacterium]
MKRCVPIIFIACLGSCITAPGLNRGAVVALDAFFRQCEADIERAKVVIVERDLIKTLTHLQHMDGGGEKYYLLERESITEMITSVTEGAYADFMLINRRGTIIYTMENEELFAQNAGSGRGGSLAAAVYGRRDAGVALSGPEAIAGKPDRRYIAVHSNVSGSGTMPGIFALLVDCERIRELAGANTAILDRRGHYIIAEKEEIINTRHPDFEAFDLDSRGGARTCTIPEYRVFRFRDTLWVLVGQ